MGEQYSGNPNNFPADFTLPDDSSPPTAAEVNVGLEALGDRTAWLRARLAKAIMPEPTIITATQDIVFPESVYDVELLGWGGGGGGGGGAAGANTALVAAQAGAGGGAALARRVHVRVTPGVVYEVVIGAGGSGGAGGIYGGAAAGHGGPGGDTIFRVKATSEVLARFPGAQGGWAGRELEGLGDPQFYRIAPGGSPVLMGARVPVTIVSGEGDDARTFSLCYGPGFGGDGKHQDGTGSIPCQGSYSIEGFAGGLSGIGGGSDAGSIGGAGGGGGAGGPSGAGGHGGNGGAASSTAAGSPGANGTSPAPNTGAGGGGGGAGGAGVGAGGNGGSGAAGASGCLIITPIFTRLVEGP